MNTDSRGVITKVYAIRSKSYPVQQCKLSVAVIALLGLSTVPSGTVQVFRASKRCDADDAECKIFYLFWLGEVSSHSDGVELSQTLLKDFSIKEHSEVYMSSEIPNVFPAVDVRVQPLSKFDWDIASTQAAKIEGTLLRNVSVVALDTVLHAHVSASLVAKFKVTHIATSNSSADNGTQVARLTNSTSLIIAPYVDAHSKENREESDLNLNAFDLPNLLAKVSSSICFRVMPACHNSASTGYLARENRHDETVNRTPTDILDTLINGAVQAPTTLAKSESMTYVWSNISVEENNINAVYIHPLALKSCLEVIAARTVSESELQDVMIKHKYSTWICTITPIVSTNMVSLTRKVLFTDIVRPYYAVVPTSVRKALGDIGDHEKIQVTIFMRSPCIFPTAIRLCPLFHTDKVELMKNDGTETEIEDNSNVVDAIVRFIDSHSSMHNPCMLSHNQVISLDSGRKEEKTMMQDYVVHLDVDRTTTRENSAEASLRHVMLSLLDQSDLLYRLLPSITVDHSHPIRSLSPSSSQQVKLKQTREVPFPDVVAVFSFVLRRVMRTLLPCISPSAIEMSLRRGICPSNIVMLTGRLGSGKSTLLTSLPKHCHSLPNVMTQYGYVDCVALKDLPVDRILSTLTQSFQSAREKSPYILSLDNLDVLVKSSREGGLIKDEKALLVSMHISRHLLELRKLFKKAFQKAAFIWQSLDPTANDGNNFNRSAAIYKFLEACVVVLGSATALDDMDSVLFSPDRFQHIISIPSLQDDSRCLSMLSMLRSSHVRLSKQLSYEEKTCITRYTEGFVIGDIVDLCNLLRAKAYSRAFATVKEKLLAGLDDSHLSVDISMEQYATVSYDEIYSYLRSFSASGSISSYSEPSDLSWSDVGGYDGLKRMILDMIRNPVLYKRLYKKIPMKLPKCILLYGMPGTGKTHLARAAGREFGTGFLCVRGPQLLDKYIGASEKAVRDLFVKAQDMNRPVLIFFDEFEALAARRGKDNTGITDRVVNQLLTFIDGVDSINQNKDIYIIAATSRPELVDPALLRPGRIDQHIYVPLPDEEDRKSILTAHIRNCFSAPSDVGMVNGLIKTIDELAQDTKNMTAADLKSLVNTAYLIAVHDLIDHAGEDISVRIQSSHLLQALQDTKPSLSLEDTSMYESIYRVFQGKGTEKSANRQAFKSDDIHPGQLDAYKIFKQQKFTYK